MSIRDPSLRKIELGKVKKGPPRTCNRHSDCSKADEKAKEKGRLWADHCHDSCCEDCFGY